MKIGLIFRLLFRSSKVQRKRAALTIAGIAWGTVSILLLLAFGQGLYEQISTNKRGMGENLAVLWMGQTSKPYKGLPEGRPIRTRIEDIELIRERVTGLEGVSGEIQQWGVNISRDGNTFNTHVRGVHPCYGELRNQIPEPGGRFIDPLDLKNKRRVIFLGDELARDLFGTQDPIGKFVLLNETPYMVIGVLIKKLMMGNYGGMDADHAVIPISTLHAQFGRENLSVIVVKPQIPEMMDETLRQVRQALGGKYGFDPDDEKVFGVWDTRKGAAMMDKILVGLEVFLGIIGAMTLLIGGIGVGNIMYAVVKERTKEIGVKMALGARRSWITGPIILESLVFTFFGGLAGLFIASGIVWLLSMMPTEGNRALEMLGVPVLSVPIGMGTAGILGLIGLVAGYFPARRAASIDPALTLRYE